MESAPLLDAYNALRPSDKTTTFCHAPASNLYFDRRGRVVACCHNRTAVLGYYPQQSISEIWNGEVARQLRSKLAANDLSMGCGVCENDLRHNKLEDVRAHQFDSFGSTSTYPAMMEFELSNVCNLECTMCIGELSSSIRKNRDKLPPVKNPYDEEFLEQLEEFLPHLKAARFSGGEPFLIRPYFKIWRQLVATNPDCLISVQTNGTRLTPEIHEIMEAGRFEIGVSLDSVTAEVFESIRKNAEFSAVEENVRSFADYCSRKGTDFRLSMCVMPSNWSELPALVAYANKLDAYVSFHQVLSPRGQSLWALPLERLEEIYDHLSRIDIQAWNDKTETNRQHYLNYVKQIQVWLERPRDAGNYQAMDSESMETEVAVRLRGSVQDHAKLAASEREDAILSLENKLAFLCADIGEGGRRALLSLLLDAQPVDIVDALLENDHEQLKVMRDLYAVEADD